jgi:hypothetical protein
MSSMMPVSKEADSNDASAIEAVLDDDIPALLDQPDAPALELLDESSL